jgi:hypothetical protein
MRLFILNQLVCLVSASVFAAGGVIPGSGTADDPYLIEDFKDFQVFTHHSCPCDKPGVYTHLMCDIDLDPSLPGRDILNRSLIGNYRGIFNGNNHTISNLSLVNEHERTVSSFFYEISEGAEVANLNLKGCNISSGGGTAGLLCGENNGTISYCNVNGRISGSGIKVGGICGINYGEELKARSLLFSQVFQCKQFEFDN